MDQSSQICSLLYELAKTQNGRNVEMDINGAHVLLVQRLEDADYVLRRRAANYRKNLAWLRQALGPSRFSEDGPAWEIRRDVTQPHFNRFDRRRTFSLAATYARIAADQMIANSSRGAPTIDDDVLREMTAGLLVENFFDIKLADTPVDLGLLAELMECGSEYSFVPPGKTSDLYRDRLGMLPDLRRRVLDNLRVFRSDAIPRTPMLDAMRSADRDAGTRVVLEHELTAFFAAGTETAAATMSWACYLLAANPRLQEELSAIARAFWQSGEPDGSDLSRLKPLGHFISETLRLYPPTPIIARLATSADRIGTHEIAKDQIVLISFVGVQHDVRHRADPWTVDIHEGPTKPGSGELTAFSFGPRVCGGKQFAQIELVTFLSVFLVQARFELASHAPPRFHWKAQMLREGGQPVRVLPQLAETAVAMGVSS